MFTEALFTIVKTWKGIPVMAQQLMNPTSIHEDSVQSLALLSGSRIQCCSELWCRMAATALTGPIAWEPPNASGVALKSKKQNKTKKHGSNLNVH